MSGQAIAQENPATSIGSVTTPRAPWRIQAISVLPEYRLAVTFMDGKAGMVDCSTILAAANPGIYAPLADPQIFAQVVLELGVPTWPNGADLDPAWLYDQVSGGKIWAVPF